MNNRVTEIIKSLGIVPESEHYEIAEKIILECAEVSFKHWEQHKGCSAHFPIREHFGVEE